MERERSRSRSRSRERRGGEVADEQRESGDERIERDVRHAGAKASARCFVRPAPPLHRRRSLAPATRTPHRIFRAPAPTHHALQGQRH